MGKLRVSISHAKQPAKPSGAIELHTLAPATAQGWEWLFLDHAEPDLLIVRNPVTKEAFVLPAVALNRMRQAQRQIVLPMSPSRGVWLAETQLDLTAQAARHGFNPGWLSQAELVGVRLTLVGQAYRSVRLEDFQLHLTSER